MIEDIEPVIIASEQLNNCLGAFFSKAPNEDELKIIYSSKFLNTVELLLKIIRKGAGWIEYDRGLTTTVNKKCKFNKGCCTNKEKLLSEKVTDTMCFRCVDRVRNNCEFYIQKDLKEFEVNYVVVKKIGQIRGL